MRYRTVGDMTCIAAVELIMDTKNGITEQTKRDVIYFLFIVLPLGCKKCSSHGE